MYSIWSVSYEREIMYYPLLLSIYWINRPPHPLKKRQITKQTNNFHYFVFGVLQLTGLCKISILPKICILYEPLETFLLPKQVLISTKDIGTCFKKCQQRCQKYFFKTSETCFDNLPPFSLFLQLRLLIFFKARLLILYFYICIFSHNSLWIQRQY